MSEPVVPRRVIASNSTDFVLFRIGMRFNGLRGFVPAFKTFARMPKMLAEQQSNPAIGMLWSSTSLSWPVISITQFWRSFEELERYAHAETHTDSWKWFNQLGGDNEGTGIYHETYRISAGTYEAIYANMPLYGLAAVAGSEAIAPAMARARARIEREPAA